jgi:hypothetical protein
VKCRKKKKKKCSRCLPLSGLSDSLDSSAKALVEISGSFCQLSQCNVAYMCDCILEESTI